MRPIRLSRLAMIPQGAMNSLNPVMRIDKQLVDGMDPNHHVQRGAREAYAA
jgi:ABC-type dipeptide/oligopeptide/nickel transport system ATPase component